MTLELGLSARRRPPIRARGGEAIGAIVAALVISVLSAATARAAPPLEAYARPPALDHVDLSPSGDRFALIANDNGERKLFVRFSDGAADFVTSLGDKNIVSIDWVGDDHLLVFAADTVGWKDPSPFSRQQVLGAAAIDLRAKTVRVIFEHSTKFLNAVFGYYGSVEESGHAYGIFGAIPLAGGTAKDNGRVTTLLADLYRVDLDSGEASLFARSSDKSSQWAFDAAGDIVAHSTVDSKAGIWTLFAGGGADRPLDTVRISGDGVFLAGLGRTAGTVLLHDLSGVGAPIQEVNVVAKGEAVALSGNQDSVSVFHDRVTGLAIGVTVEASPGAALFDEGLQKRIAATARAFPGEQVHLTSFDKTFNRLIVLTDGPHDSGTYWLVNIAKKNAVPIGPIRPDIKPADIAPSRTISFTAADGLALDGMLTLPIGKPAGNLPLVVLPRAAPNGGRAREGFNFAAQAFASRGYAVFTPNFRGALEYSAAFRQAGEGEFGRKMLTDIADGVVALARTGQIDPKRVCIVGSDYGGYVAVAEVTLQQRPYACAVAVNGFFDLEELERWRVEKTVTDAGAVARWRAHWGVAKAADMRALSPIGLAARADAPILLLHGDDDTVIPIEQSQRMARALKAAAKPVEFVTMAGAGHDLGGLKVRLTLLKAAVAFVEKYNPAG